MPPAAIPDQVPCPKKIYELHGSRSSGTDPLTRLELHRSPANLDKITPPPDMRFEIVTYGGREMY